MNRRIRWVPAKSASLGQAVTAGVPVAVPATAAEVQPTANKSVLEKIIYGGLIVAGAAAFITFVFGSQD